MNGRSLAVTLLALVASCGGAEKPREIEKIQPISLHPQNPHYFLFRGKPTILITSGEHYGAVLNLDFDYSVYLKTLKADGLNHTRVWAGTYREIPGSFGITQNSLAPLPERYICPWARSDSPGYNQGGNKFDLTKWDEAYFKRLKDFMIQASAVGVVVEMNLWCPNYDEALWKASPLHVSNNVNGVGTCGKDETYTLLHENLVAVQEATTRKIVRELADFDNLYYEICNEPYFAGVAMDWQHRIADIIVDEEKNHSYRHLISQNIANGRAKIEKPHPAVSIFNFHYCVPPDVVPMNWALDKVIGENETGFRGKEDVLYRTEGWDFLHAGGGLYNNLDYSFSAKHPDGTLLDYTSPGGGNPTFRKQLSILRRYLNGFDFIAMTPMDSLVRSKSIDGLRHRVLAEPGKQYAIYFYMPPGGGTYSVRWTGSIDPQFTESTTFYATGDGGVRLWVDNRKLVDTWGEPGVKEESGTLNLVEGQRVKIVMESRGGKAAKLAWSGARTKKQVVPKARLVSADAVTGGLTAEYYEDADLRTKKLSRVDPKVEFDWSQKGPFPLDSRQRSFEALVEVQSGSYLVDWVNPKTGQIDKSIVFSSSGGSRALQSPLFSDDIALRIRRQ